MNIKAVIKECAISLLENKKVVAFDINGRYYLTFDSISMFLIPNYKNVFPQIPVNTTMTTYQLTTNELFNISKCDISVATIGTKEIDVYKTGITYKNYNCFINKKAMKYFDKKCNVAWNVDKRLFEIYENGLLCGIVAPLMKKF